MRRRYPRRTRLKKWESYYFPPKNEMPNFALATEKSIYPLILDVINSARTSLCLSFFQFTINKNHLIGIPLGLFSALNSRRQEGVETRVLVNSKFANGIQRELNRRTLEFLRVNNIDVRWSNPRRINHTKLIIADGKRAYIGSANLTISSLAENWEIGVLIESKAVEIILMPYFEKLWEGAR